MGVKLKDLLVRREVTFDELSGKVLAFDTYNMLFQFLSSIRGPDGQLLSTSNGEISSHLIGLFSRISTFLEKGIKPIFVFDGKHPELKHKEVARRVELKKQAEAKYKEALESGDEDEIRKFASRTSRLTKDMVASAKELITLFGLPVVQAPSEGEGQAAYLVHQDQAWAVASQDFDSVLYATPYLVRNLSIAGKRRRPGTRQMINISPEIVDLKQTLESLQITQRQLIHIGMLVGTDYNAGGIKGIGPKKALKLVKQFEDPEVLFKEAKWDDHCDVDWKDVLECFINLPVEDFEVEFRIPKIDELKTFLIDRFEFGSERVERTLSKIQKKKEARSQSSLSSFL